MGVFFRKSESLEPVVLEEFSLAIASDPNVVSNVRQAAAEHAKVVIQRVQGEFSWGRMLFAVALLALVFAGAVYTARDAALAQLYSVLVHGFEILLGGVAGLLLGEAVAKG
jgi:hypothetical protein